MLAARATVLWALGRLTLLIFGAYTVRLSMPASIALIGLVAWLTFLDAQRRREVLLLANLGVGHLGVLVTAALPAAGLEAVTWLLG